MENFIVTGGKRLAGSVAIGGAKNAALPILAATLLAPGTHRIHNVPHLRDVVTMKHLLEHLGCNVTWNGAIEINADHLNFDEAPYELVKTMRASVLVMGPLMGRVRHARISLPGGCAIGARPINLHPKAFEQMGADISLNDGYVDIVASRLRGTQVEFDTVTVTGTANVMMAATVARGTTTILNAAREPEVVDLAQFLIAMGADIEGAGSDRITIHHCLFAQNADRSPRLAGGLYDVVNNVIYNWSHHNAAKIGGGAHVNLVHNAYIPGPQSTTTEGCILPEDPNQGTKLYLAGNITPLTPKGTEDQWLSVTYWQRTKDKWMGHYPAPSKFQAPKPFPVTIVTTQPAKKAYDRVLARAGARVRDTDDLRVIQEVNSRSGQAGGGQK